MSLRIQTNVEAFNAQRHLSATTDKIATAMERLSSGYRINRAADDAAGLPISEKLTAQINGLEHAMNALSTYQENLVASESRIKDVDMAAEMVEYTKLQVLQQAGTSVLAQANQSSQGVLSLLR